MELQRIYNYGEIIIFDFNKDNHNIIILPIMYKIINPCIFKIQGGK